MTIRAAGAKKTDDPMAVPAFLLVKRARGRGEAPASMAPRSSIAVKPDSEGARLNEGLTPYGLRVPARGESGETGFRIDEGVVPRHWARDPHVVMELARRVAAKKEQYERGLVNRDEARAKNQEERARIKAKMYRGMIKLEVLLGELGDGAPSLGRAKKAIERAHMIHRKFHFGPKEVEQARQVLRSVPVTPSRSGTVDAPRTGASTRSIAPIGLIRVHVKTNPHRAGSVQHDRMAVLMFHAGQSVADYLAVDGCRHKLKHALDQGWVTLDQTAGATVAPSGPASSGATRDPKKAPPTEASKPAKATRTAKKAVLPAKAKKVRRR